MARIGSYNNDDNVSGQDKVLGTDSAGSTKNYTLNSIGEFFSKKNVIKSNVEFPVLFVNSQSDIGYATLSRLGFGGSGQSMVNFSSFLISKFDANGDSINSLIRRVLENRITISSYENQDTYCDYEVVSVENSVDYPNFLEIQVNSISGAGTFLNNGYYIFSVAHQVGDKNYEHEQSSPSSQWVVNHNLGKKPAVSVVDSAGTIIICEVEYNSTNQVTLIFDAATSGKAIFN